MNTYIHRLSHFCTVFSGTQSSGYRLVIFESIYTVYSGSSARIGHENELVQERKCL